MKPFATIQNGGTSLTNHTGSWRTERPVYVHRLPPCNKACPAGENIQAWLSLVEQEKYESAWREIVSNNPFPAVMGRICYHPCEGACNRMALESPVNINGIERFLGDLALKKAWAFDKPAPASGKNILVVGAGPAGLSAAYHLTRFGHNVTIKEAAAKAGGMMRYGIPSYRLPRSVLDAEIGRIVKYGAKIDLNSTVPSLFDVLKSNAFDAMFLSTGAPRAKTAKFRTDPCARVVDAISFLRDMEGTAPPHLGKRVVVYGGGNTAMDVARTARRLGAEEVTIVYRRTKEKMPAHAFEIDGAVEEGVKIKYLVTIESFEDKKLSLEKMELNNQGFPQPTGKKETMPADCVVLALGQDIDTAFFDGVSEIDCSKGFVPVDQHMMTNRSGVFAGGDLVYSDKTATTAIGHGKKAALHIDAWLNNAPVPVREKSEDATIDKLNTWYYAPAHRNERSLLDISKRTTTFDEIQKGLAEPEALAEARRCLSCGNCFECDNCYGFCPDNAIRKLGAGQGFEIDYNYCKGCGLCVAECPCGSIRMEPEKT